MTSAQLTVNPCAFEEPPVTAWLMTQSVIDTIRA